MLTSFVGNSMSMAPELLQKSEYTYEVDAWAVGVVLLSLWLNCRVNKLANGGYPALVESFPTKDQL